jgi:hypothetical protein
MKVDSGAGKGQQTSQAITSPSHYQRRLGIRGGFVDFVRFKMNKDHIALLRKTRSTCTHALTSSMLTRPDLSSSRESKMMSRSLIGSVSWTWSWSLMTFANSCLSVSTGPGEEGRRTPRGTAERAGRVRGSAGPEAAPAQAPVHVRALEDALDKRERRRPRRRSCAFAGPRQSQPRVAGALARLRLACTDRSCRSGQYLPT